jgi:hypothetical protein
MPGYVSLDSDGKVLPLNLNMKDGKLELVARAAGVFTGDVTFELTGSLGFQTHCVEIINDTSRNAEAVLGNIHFKGPPGTLFLIWSDYLHQAAFTAGSVPASMGKLRVNNITSDARLRVDGVDLHVNNNISAPTLEAQGAAIACNGQLSTTLNSNDTSLIVAGPASAVSSIEQVLINAHHESIYTIDTYLISLAAIADRIQPPGTTPPAISVPYTWNGNNSSLSFSALESVSPDPPSYTIFMDGIGAFPLLDSADFNSNEKYLEELEKRNCIFTLTYFVLAGKDTAGQFRIWHIYNDSPAPNVQELYEVWAVFYHYGGGSAVLPASVERNNTSIHSGGVLGGGSVDVLAALVAAQAATAKPPTPTVPGSGSGSGSGSAAAPASTPAAPPEEPAPPEENVLTVSTGQLSGEALKDIIGELEGGTVTGLVITGSSEDDSQTFTVPAELTSAAEKAEIPITFESGDMSLHMPSGVVTQAKGKEITVHLEMNPTLNEEQAEAADGRPAVSVKVYFGSELQSQLSTPITFAIKYDLAEGEHFSGLILMYLNPDGTLTEISSWYEDGYLYGTLPHLSILVIAYDPELVWENPFSDVSQRAWYYPAVRYAFKGGLMNGLSESVFAPDADMSRAMFVTILYRMEESPGENLPDSPFGDVNDGAWYYDATRWAADAGIVLGDDKGRFNPNQPVTREQMITMLFRYLQAEDDADADAVSRFKDSAAISSWAEAAMFWAAKEQVVTGFPDGTIRPAASVTRAQTAQIIMNYLEKV